MIAAMEQAAAQVQECIDWSAVRRDWDAMLERHDKERADFIRDLVEMGARQSQLAEHLNLTQQRVAQLLDYAGVVSQITTAVVTDQPTPSEWELRPFVQKAAVEVAEEQGVERVRSRAEVHARAAEKFIEATSKPHVAHNSGENEWYTPPDYIEAARSVLGEIDCDPASSDIAQATVKAKRHYTKANDGLIKRWKGRVWMNPPYEGALIKQFIDKLCESIDAGDVKDALVLVNNATETTWFQQLAAHASGVCFPRGRVRFLDPQGNPGAPLQGQAVVYIGENTDGFREHFSQFGFVAAL